MGQDFHGVDRRTEDGGRGPGGGSGWTGGRRDGDGRTDSQGASRPGADRQPRACTRPHGPPCAPRPPPAPPTAPLRPPRPPTQGQHVALEVVAAAQVPGAAEVGGHGGGRRGRDCGGGGRPGGLRAGRGRGLDRGRGLWGGGEDGGPGARTPSFPPSSLRDARPRLRAALRLLLPGSPLGSPNVRGARAAVQAERSRPR